MFLRGREIYKSQTQGPFSQYIVRPIPKVIATCLLSMNESRFAIWISPIHAIRESIWQMGMIFVVCANHLVLSPALGANNHVNFACHGYILQILVGGDCLCLLSSIPKSQACLSHYNVSRPKSLTKPKQWGVHYRPRPSHMLLNQSQGPFSAYVVHLIISSDLIGL